MGGFEIDIELPDGTVMQGVPEGTTKLQLLQKLQANKHPAAAQLSHDMAQQQVANDPISKGAQNFTDDMSGFEKFNAGMGKAFSNIGSGTAQLVGLGPRKEETQETRRLDRPLMHTVPGYAGNLVGNMAAAAPLMMVPGANTIGGAAAMSAIAGGMQMGSPLEKLMDIGSSAALGGGVQAAAQNPVAVTEGIKNTARNLINGPKALFEPLYAGGQDKIISRAMNNAAGGNAQNAIANMRNAAPLVPGSIPTAAEVANSGGIASMQRSAAALEPEGFTTRAAANNEARVGALRDLAGTQGERTFTAANRDATAQDLYKQAYDVGIDLNQLSDARRGEITKLLKTPALQQASKDARALAQNEMVNIKNPSGSVKGLDYMKRALDDQISKATGNEQRVLVDLKHRFLTTVDTLSPEYAAARKVYSDMSKPLTEMDVIQQVLDRSVRPLDQRLMPNSYARALSDDTAQGVTGMRNSTLENTVSPEKLSRLNAIREDLAREQFAANAGRGAGSDTVQKLSMSNLSGRSGIPQGILNLPGVGRVGDWLYSRADAEMRKQLAQALLNPQEAARIMSMTKQRATVPELPQAARDQISTMARILLPRNEQNQ